MTARCYDCQRLTSMKLGSSMLGFPDAAFANHGNIKQRLRALSQCQPSAPENTASRSEARLPATRIILSIRGHTIGVLQGQAQGGSEWLGLGIPARR